MGSGKSLTVILKADDTNTSPATTNRKGGYRGGEPLPSKGDRTTQSIDRAAQIATSEQKMLPVEAGGLRTPSNLGRGGCVSEQGLIEAENRWLNGHREAETIQPSPIVGSQYRSAEELPRFPPAVRRETPPGKHQRRTKWRELEVYL